MISSIEEGICAAGQLPLPEGEGWYGAGTGWESYADQLASRLGSKVSASSPQVLPTCELILLIWPGQSLIREKLSVRKRLARFIFVIMLLVNSLNTRFNIAIGF